MFHRITACVILTAACLPFCANCQDVHLNDDMVRKIEMQQRAILESLKPQGVEVIDQKLKRLELERRQFESQFNRLATAVAAFASKYNAGHGTVWPRREADQLRDAMRQLQSMEKSLRDRGRETPEVTMISTRD
jgi:hypothetical protein